jgi:hypothetical protein
MWRSKEKAGNCHVLLGNASLLLAEGCLFGHFLAALQHSLKIAQQLSNSLEHFPAAFLDSLRSVKWLSNSLEGHFLAAISRRQAISVHFPLSSLFTFINIKNEGK